MEGEEGGNCFQPGRGSVKMSPPVRIDFGCSDSNMKLEANNNCGSSAQIDRPSSKDCVTVSQEEELERFAIAVSQVDESDVSDVSREDDEPSLRNSDAVVASDKNVATDTSSKTKPNRRRKSTTDTSNTSTRASTRRRSLRLQSRALEPLTPEGKMPTDNDATGDDKAPGMSCEPSNATDELDASQLSARMSAQAKSSKSPAKSPKSTGLPAVASAKKSPSRRKRRPSSALTKDEGGLSPKKPAAAGSAKKSNAKRNLSDVREDMERGGDLMLSPKKRSREVKEVPSLNLSRIKGDDVLPSPKKLNLGGKNMPDKGNTNALQSLTKIFGEKDIEKRVPVDFSKQTDYLVLSTPYIPSLGKTVDPPSFKIGISENGHAQLAQALERITLEVVIGPSSFVNVSKRKSLSGRRRSKKHSRRSQASSQVFLSSTATKENVLNSSNKKDRSKKRRDTFDLSKNRGLACTANRLKELNVLIDKNISFEEETKPEYSTPKAGSTEVNIDAIVKEISRTLDDEPQKGGCLPQSKEDSAESVELSVVRNNLQNLTSIAIEDEMRKLFPDRMKQVYRYPCVSARIFAAMSTVYESRENFTTLFPFFLSLVDAEIVSLENQEDSEPCFVNKKVCFSGFDYSSTRTTLGEVVGQGGGDLRPSIEALEIVLKQALELSRPVHYLDVAIQCLQCMYTYGDASGACAKTMVGYFPSARFRKAFKHYLNEMNDVKSFLLSQHVQASDRHIGVRYRLNDFIGRSVRYHLRELINTIPEHVVDFNVDECEERWGRAVDDRSTSSILNFSLEKIYELMIYHPTIFDYEAQILPDFFMSEASHHVHSMSVEGLKNINKSTHEQLVSEITEARSFLFGARACKFFLNLLQSPGVEEHINAQGGWAPVEAITSTFYHLNLHEGSENEHFVQLREVRELTSTLEDVNQKLEQKVDHCEFCIRRLRRKFNIKTSRRSLVHNLKLHIAGEKGEHFPIVVAMQ